MKPDSYLFKINKTISRKNTLIIGIPTYFTFHDTSIVIYTCNLLQTFIIIHTNCHNLILGYSPKFINLFKKNKKNKD